MSELTRLSRTPPDDLVVDTPREILAFDLAGETYAFPLAAVREILRVPLMTPVPRAPSPILGVISVRGKITTVVDLRRMLRLKGEEPDRRARVLLIDNRTEVVGVLVDRVQQVHHLVPEDVEDAGVVSSDVSDFVLGVGRPRDARGARANDDDIIILLDPTSILRHS